MPFAIAHALIPILILQITGRYSEKLRSVLTWHRLLIVGFFGFASDLDVAVGLIVNLFYHAGELHRTLSHSLFIPLIIFAAAISVKKWRIGLMFIGFGWLTHPILDFIVSGTLPLFYPFRGEFGLKILAENASTFSNILTLIALDITVLVIWILYNRKILFRK